jgi:hypothetical protein
MSNLSTIRGTLFQSLERMKDVTGFVSSETESTNVPPGEP